MLRFAWATFGRVLFGRAAAIACGMGLVAAILFAPQGLRAADIVRWTDASPMTRLAPWVLWLALAVPPVGAALRAPGTKLLRAMPFSTARLAATFFGFVLALHVPWAIFFHRASGPLRAASSTVLALACVAVLVGPIRMFPLAIACLAAGFAPPAVGIAVGIPLAAIACDSAWRHGAEPRSVWTVPIPRVGFLAIGITFVLAFVRRERVRGVLAAGVLVGGRALSTIFVRNGAFDRPGWMLVPAACVAIGAIAPVLLREAERLRWIAPRPWLPIAVAFGVASLVVVPFGTPCALALPLGAIAMRWKRGGTEWALVVVGFAVIATIVWRIVWRIAC